MDGQLYLIGVTTSMSPRRGTLSLVFGEITSSGRPPSLMLTGRAVPVTEPTLDAHVRRLASRRLMRRALTLPVDDIGREWTVEGSVYRFVHDD
ncbi:hypothetical protein [Pseudonocardia oroxyli]|uniref:Uncharacterized protein n=1 Tax=Pseudonocardia oroxyli TaxID=366584 RepID=A0A1G7TG87_PSEOR|nr:hypothetical protein [Pseudonocardia oroxyli]SDG34255.1 hypothetical protein SAMN05216377_11122 [Pseudonocardia oroxyli]